jgi:hypothetical protein
MRFSLRTHITDVWYIAGHTARCDTVDVRLRAWSCGQCVTRKPNFHQPSHTSCFSYFRVILVELGLIEDFSYIWRTRIFQNIWRRFSIHVSFKSYNVHCYFSCTAHLFCVSRKYAYFTIFTVYTYCT